MGACAQHAPAVLGGPQPQPQPAGPPPVHPVAPAPPPPGPPPPGAVPEDIELAEETLTMTMSEHTKEGRF